MSRLRAIVVALFSVAVAGCGGSSSHTISQVNPSTTSSAPGVKTFSAPGMALRFQFPAAMRTIPLSPAKRLVGNTNQATRAAVGLGPFDLLVVIRYPHRPIPVTAKNVAGLKSAFDRALSQAFGRTMVSQVTSAGGLPALAYPAVPTLDLPVSATARNTLAFTGDDEYQLICQYTPKRQAAITAACDQMLATLSATR